jgi:hypothetical protein
MDAIWETDSDGSGMTWQRDSSAC